METNQHIEAARIAELKTQGFTTQEAVAEVRAEQIMDALEIQAELQIREDF